MADDQALLALVSEDPSLSDSATESEPEDGNTTPKDSRKRQSEVIIDEEGEDADNRQRRGGREVINLLFRTGNVLNSMLMKSC
jgi:hypothetical protein